MSTPFLSAPLPVVLFFSSSLTCPGPLSSLSRPSFLAFVPSPCTPSFRDVVLYVLLLSPLCLSSPSVSHSLSLLTPSFPSFSHLLFCFMSFLLPSPFFFSSFSSPLFFSHPFVCICSFSSLLFLCHPNFSPPPCCLFPFFRASWFPFILCLFFSFMSALSYFLPPSSCPCPLASSISSFYFLPSCHLSSTFSIYFLSSLLHLSADN